MIKSIIYLDEAKMYSMSSQIFEGVTEYILNEFNSSKEEKEEQKGPIGSGRVLADAMILGQRSLERKFLHDHSLSLFEEKLQSENLINRINSASECFSLDKSFVKINARAKFIDAAKVTSILNSFNAIGEALTYITKYPELEAARQAILQERNPAEQKKLQTAFKAIERKFHNISDFAKIEGLYQDPGFLKNLALVTEFGFSDQLEIQQQVGDRLFSACLKREYLREPEDIIMRKYSRHTEKPLVVLGVVTQSRSEPEVSTLTEAMDNPTMKEAVTNMVDHIAAFEGSITGKTPSEIIVDPIAVYVNL